MTEPLSISGEIPTEAAEAFAAIGRRGTGDPALDPAVRPLRRGSHRDLQRAGRSPR